MAVSQENVSMALFCDFENVALGVQDANYDKFDIKRVLERLLLKGSIVVKKAYCDWGRYQGFKAAMHEANFELIDIPHVRQSGKNSADIRLVVDALDLCYTKLHVDTFVIISGDSDFSPLVSKLRENAKQVIGVGVKRSTSDLLIANCDEFIFYDDLVRESQRSAAKRERRNPPASSRRSSEGEDKARDDVEAKRTQAIDLAVETFDALASERGDSGKIWASVLKEAIKRRRPDFNESYYGFRAFGNLLEAAQERGLLAFGRDEKSGAYVYRHSGAGDESELVAERAVRAPAVATPAREGQGEGGAQAPAAASSESSRRSRSGRKLDGRGNGRGERGAARHGRSVDAAEAGSAVAVNDTQAAAGVVLDAAPAAVQEANPAPARDQGLPAPVSHASAGDAAAPQAATEASAPAASPAEAAPRRSDSRRSGGRSSGGGSRRQAPRTEQGDSTAQVAAPVVAPAPVVSDTSAPAADTAAAAPKKAPRKRTTKTAGTTATRSRRASKTEGADTPAKATSKD